MAGETALTTFCNALPPLTSVRGPFPDAAKVLSDLLALPYLP